MSDNTEINYHLEDFTEQGYRSIIRLAKPRYKFEPYNTTSTEPHALWRHDVDFSVHRALRLAQIEAEEGVQSTYFFLLHSEFYNVLEPGVTAIIREIISLGHHLGLHFDAAYYAPIQTQDDLERPLVFEKEILERIFSKPVNAFSFHNTDVGGILKYDADKIGGMVNAYGAKLKGKYKYCSDSNGYWRFKRMPDMIEEGADYIQILTHPEWWTPTAMVPRERVQRCIDGRAKMVGDGYDALLENLGRLNVK